MLHTLPDALVLRVLSWLWDWDLCAVAQTCRRLRRLASRDALWGPLLLAVFACHRHPPAHHPRPTVPAQRAYAQCYLRERESAGKRSDAGPTALPTGTPPVRLSARVVPPVSPSPPEEALFQNLLTDSVSAIISDVLSIFGVAPPAPAAPAGGQPPAPPPRTPPAPGLHPLATNTAPPPLAAEHMDGALSLSAGPLCACDACPPFPVRHVNVALTGPLLSGKTALLARFLQPHEPFNALSPGSTLCATLVQQRRMIHGELRTLRIWDLSGSSRYRSTYASFYRQCDGVVVVGDVMRREDLDALPGWLEEVEECASNGGQGRPPPRVVLVANKMDIVGQGGDRTQRLLSSWHTLASVHGCPLVFASAARGLRVRELFDAVLAAALPPLQ